MYVLGDLMVILLALLLLIFIHLELFQENLLLILRQQGMYLLHPLPSRDTPLPVDFGLSYPHCSPPSPSPKRREDYNWSAWLPISV